jgi:hypothetical protein
MGRVGEANKPETPEQMLARFPQGELESGSAAYTAPTDMMAALAMGKGLANLAGVAFHGSPHIFEQLSREKIGTGEGGAAFGHGLYFAEHPDTARSYRPEEDWALTKGKKQVLLSDIINDHKRPAGDPEQWAASTVWAKGGVDQAIDYFQGLLQKAQRMPIGEQLAQRGLTAKYSKWKNVEVTQQDFPLDILRKWKDQSSVQKVQPGAVYQLQVPDEHIDKMLDWDRPLSEQPEAKAIVDKILAPVDKGGRMIHAEGPKPVSEVSGKWTGSEAYHVLADYFRDRPSPQGGQYRQLFNKPAASDALEQAGIPGIKYLDQFSRNVDVPKLKADLADAERSYADWKRIAPRNLTQQQAAMFQGWEDNIAKLKEKIARPQTRNFVVFNPEIIKDFKRLE